MPNDLQCQVIRGTQSSQSKQPVSTVDPGGRREGIPYAGLVHLMLQVESYHWGVTRSAAGADDEPDVEWLTAEELAAWLSVVRLMTWLPWSIDQQLRRDSKVGMVDYQVMAMLSESANRTMRMSSLAEVTNASLSRLSRV